MLGKKIISAVLAGMIIFSFSGCGKVNEDKSKYGTLPKELWRDVKYSRYIVPKDEKEKKKELDQYLHEYKDKEKDIKHDVNLDLRLKNTISKDEALNDLNYLFNEIKFSYAGYQYFGGDNKFEETKNNIKLKLDQLGNEIDTTQMVNILIKELDFIKDNKFVIDNTSVAPSRKYIFNDELNILKDDKGYYIEENNKKLYIQYLGNDAIEKNIKISIDKNGDIKYVIGKLSDDNEELMTINLYDGMNYSKKPIKLKYKKPEILNDSLCKLYKKDDISIIESRRLNIKSDKEKNELKDVINNVKTLDNEKYIIVDLRGNLGGIEPYPSTWVEAMTQGLLSSNMLWANLKTQTVSNLNKTDFMGKQEYDVAMDIGEEIKVKPVVVVLMDDNVRESGEILVNSLKYLDNVIFAGTNTSGSMLTTNILKNCLPNSGVKFSYGSCMGFNTHFNNIDRDGFQPHIWINGEDDIDRLVKFLNKNSFDIK